MPSAGLEGGKVWGQLGKAQSRGVASSQRSVPVPRESICFDRQLLKGTIDSVQDIGPPITSRVQAMVLNTFSEFLKR